MEASEVLFIEGQNALDAMDAHGGNEPCVVYLDSRDAIVNQQPSPFLVYRGAVGEQPKPGFNFSCSNTTLHAGLYYPYTLLLDWWEL